MRIEVGYGLAKKKKQAPHIVLSASLSLWLGQTAPKVTLEAICWRQQRPHTAVSGCLCEEGCPAELVDPPNILNKLEISIVFQPLIIWGWVSLLDWVPPPHWWTPGTAGHPNTGNTSRLPLCFDVSGKTPDHIMAPFPPVQQLARVEMTMCWRNLEMLRGVISERLK